MIITTTPTIQGQEITEYLGSSAAKQLWGPIFSKISSPQSPILSVVEPALMSRNFKRARKIALAEMTVEAQGLGGQAIVGVDLDYEVIRDGMLMVAISGTAVKIS